MKSDVKDKLFQVFSLHSIFDNILKEKKKMAELLEGKKEEENRKIIHTYPLIKVRFFLNSIHP